MQRAKMWIALSTLLISGGAAFTFLFFFHLRELQKVDPAFQILAIEHDGKLPTDYLAEVLDLSIDTTTYLPAFNHALAQERLLQNPFISTARIRKIQPNHLSVEYIVREPFVEIVDWNQAFLDRDGVLIPKMHFHEKSLDIPEMVLGDIEEEAWGKKVEGSKVALGFAILDKLQEKGERIRVDVSRAEELGLGKREVIITFLESAILLRLNPDQWMEGLVKYKELEKHEEINFEFILPEFKKRRIEEGKRLVVDLRLKDMAFYTEMNF